MNMLRWSAIVALMASMSQMSRLPYLGSSGNEYRGIHHRSQNKRRKARRHGK